jgi:hypothetical protein
MRENPNVRWKTEETIRCGLSILELCACYLGDLEPRVGAVTISGLRAALDELRNTAATAISSRAARRASTLDQDAALRKGAGVVWAFRGAIRQAHRSNKALQRDFGVGVPIAIKSIASVAGGLRTVLDAAAHHPEELRAAGLVDADVAKARETLTALTVADVTQEGRKVGSREATATRRTAQVRVQAGVSKIIAAARLAFVDQPAVLAKFTSLIPTRPRRSPKPVPAPAELAVPPV